MVYYRYIPGWNNLRDDQKEVLLECAFLPGITFVGDDKQQIRETVKYYGKEHGADIEMPDENSMVPLEMLSIQCYLPGSIPNHTICALVLDDVELFVNANIFHEVQEQAFMYKNNRRASLYKFVPNRNSILLLPERIMQAMYAYDWKQHDKQVEEWLCELDLAYQKMEECSANDLSRKVREHGADGIIMNDEGVIIFKKTRILH